MIPIHVTHEAIQKVGGIGTVIHGLLMAPTYQKMFPQTLLYTPLFHRDGDIARRLGDRSEVLYSSIDGVDSNNFRERFLRIESRHGVHIVYGKKWFADVRTGGNRVQFDIVAVDIWGMGDGPLDTFKFQMWRHFGMRSDIYSHDRDYEQYVRIGAVLPEIFAALYGEGERAVVFAHEYMGMPSALAFEAEKREKGRRGDITVFYAHEVSTARVIVESHPGHDLSFYNLMRIDEDHGRSLEERFGSWEKYSRNELIKKAMFLDHIFAVSEITKDEYMYLCPNADAAKIKVVYNGIPVKDVPFSEKEGAFRLMQDYCEHLFNYRPDFIMSHVTRLVMSKAIWRDLRLLDFMDGHMAKAGKKGFFILLSSLLGEPRSEESVIKMENEYGWPVLHKEGWPDLVGAEAQVYHQMEIFNAKSRAVKCVFVNQFGFDRRAAGRRLPEGASIFGLRLASDAEFGMSIYEPFGIAQLETIPYGGVPIVSSVCGNVGLLKGTIESTDYVEIDFTEVPQEFREQIKTEEDFKGMTIGMRDLVETELCRKNADRIAPNLYFGMPERKKHFEKMQKASKLLDWEHVAQRIKGFSGCHSRML